MKMIQGLVNCSSILAVALAVAGCTTMGPIPNTPQEFTEVFIDSIPSGADVYDVTNQDGYLGGKIGSTPCVLRVGFATATYDSGVREMGQTRLWGVGCRWSDYRSDIKGWDVLMDLALIKDGYRMARITNKNLGMVGIGKSYPPPSSRITVPLQPSQARQTEKGIVMVTCNQEGAEVTADGAFVGNSPASLRLPEGIHVIEVRKTGFAAYRKEVRVLAGSDLALRAALER